MSTFLIKVVNLSPATLLKLKSLQMNISKILPFFTSIYKKFLVSTIFPFMKSFSKTYTFP